MPIDYQQVYTQVKQIGAGVKERRQKKEQAQAKARELLLHYDSLLDELRAKVESARQAEPATRCASPRAESIAAGIHPPAESNNPVTLIAADGSQIFPDRHAAQQYYLINVGSLVMQTNSGSAPEIFTDTGLTLLDEFDETFFNESQIALQRDIAERKKLLELARQHAGTVIALTEGQLELWGAAEPEHDKSFQKSLLDYLSALRELKKQNVIAAGYVDKPAANWVIRMLEVAACADLKELRKFHPLLGATDLWLFSRILKTHERSAIFALKAKSSDAYTEDLAIHFFYLNVGDERKPQIARVDVPLWVAENPQAVNDLHAALIQQCKIMGNVKPFPYILHRAHEIAVVSNREKEEINRMLALAVQNNGGEAGEVSNKQSAKNLPGRTRM